MDEDEARRQAIALADRLQNDVKEDLGDSGSRMLVLVSTGDYGAIRQVGYGDDAPGIQAACEDLYQALAALLKVIGADITLVNFPDPNEAGMN